MRKSLPLFAVFAAACFAPAALAQQPAPPPQPQPQPAPSTIQLPVPQDTSSAVPLPPPPNVEDPMLVPVPAARVNVSTWEEALGYLRSRSTDLRIAYDEVRRAEGQTRTALGNVLTQINGTGSFRHELITTQSGSQNFNGVSVSAQGVTIPTPNVLAGSITAVQPLVNFAAWDNVSIAHRNEEAQRLSVEDLKRTLALNVANAIVGVITAERIAELNRNGLRQALERYDLTRRKQALGAANGLDVVRAQQDVESARATLVTGDESLRQSREALGLALGIPGQIGVTRDVNLAGLERSALHVCTVATDLDQRADILAAKKKLEIAKRQVDNVYYQFLPTLNAQSALSTTSVQQTPQATWNISAVLSVPIWDGGIKYGNLRQARAQEDEAAMQLEALRRTASIQIAQAHRGVVVAEQSRQVAENAQKLAAETDRLTQISYREGQATSLELVVSAAALRQADINLALQDFNLVKARVLDVLALATCPW